MRGIISPSGNLYFLEGEISKAARILHRLKRVGTWAAESSLEHKRGAAAAALVIACNISTEDGEAMLWNPEFMSAADALVIALERTLAAEGVE